MSTNDITGDALRTKPATDAYSDGYDAIDFSAHRNVQGWPQIEESDWPEDECRIDQIGQNGNTAEHYALMPPE